MKHKYHQVEGMCERLQEKFLMGVVRQSNVTGLHLESVEVGDN